MVYLLRMVISHGKLLNNQMVQSTISIQEGTMEPKATSSGTRWHPVRLVDLGTAPAELHHVLRNLQEGPWESPASLGL